MKNEISDWLNALLALAPPPEPGTTQDPAARQLMLWGPLVLMGVVFYFLLIRPQRLQAKQHEALLKSLKPGDKVLTTSGIVGTVVSVREATVFIRSADTKLELAKSAVSKITEKGGGASED